MTKKERIANLTASLTAISLPNMASALGEIYRSGEYDTMEKTVLLEKVIEPEYEAKMSKQYSGRLTRAHLKGSPELMASCVDSAERTYLPQDIVESLKTLDFVDEGMNICILGPSDSGKSYLAKALGCEACRKYRVLYTHTEEFIESLVALKVADYEKYQKKMRSYMKLDLLILDDFLLHTITDEREIKVLHEIMETRMDAHRSVIVCSQRESGSWNAMILNDEVAADAILKRATKHFTVIIKPENKS